MLIDIDLIIVKDRERNKGADNGKTVLLSNDDISLHELSLEKT